MLRRTPRLKLAYERDFAITPHPRAHALYANKRNLALLSDANALREMGVSRAGSVALLISTIPRTLNVDGDAAGWWSDRRAWFFKSAQGYGSRGSYRGDKMTRGRVCGRDARRIRGAGIHGAERTMALERTRAIGLQDGRGSNYVDLVGRWPACTRAPSFTRRREFLRHVSAAHHVTNAPARELVAAIRTAAAEAAAGLKNQPRRSAHKRAASPGCTARVTGIPARSDRSSAPVRPSSAGGPGR